MESVYRGMKFNLPQPSVDPEVSGLDYVMAKEQPLCPPSDVMRSLDQEQNTKPNQGKNFQMDQVR
jgi:hypothetical protein